jgi:hypothetical protein
MVVASNCVALKASNCLIALHKDARRGKVWQHVDMGIGDLKGDEEGE